MKKNILILLITIFSLFLIINKHVLAQDQALTGSEDPFGTIEAPPGVELFNQQAGDSGIGLIIFFSNLIKFLAVIAGLWTMLNFILAGFTYITSSGDSGAIEKIGSKLTSSVVGLAIIVASYTIAAVLGLILFGDATFIINPKIPSPI